MTKTNTPYFSLGASGSVGGSITAQKKGQSTMLREKPFPTYRYTLPQAYQRWLYEDYAYLWRQQDTATRAEYRTGGSRFHLTGFQYWMKVMLSTMPDIVAWWKLDEQTGAIAYDSSPRGKNGTIIGATSSVGFIDYCRSFDGLNDGIWFPAINFGAEGWSFEALIKAPEDRIRHRTIYIHGTPGVNPQHYFRINPTGILRFVDLKPPIVVNVEGTIVVDDDKVHHVVCVNDAAANLLRIYVDGYEDNNAPNSGTDSDNDRPTIIGIREDNVLPFWGLIDNGIARLRALDPTEVLRHSLRRYPA